MVPLGPKEILGMWRVLKRYEFRSTHGAFVGTEVRDGYGGSEKGVKSRILESMQIQVRRNGLERACVPRRALKISYSDVPSGQSGSC